MNDQRKIWKKIDQYFSKHSNYIAEPVPLKEIEESEKYLQVKFSNSYKKFVALYGGALLPTYCIYGLRKTLLMDINLNTVVSNTEFYRGQQYPGTKNWYIISDDESGNPFGVDPEGKVWLSDHDSYEIVPVAEDFEEFLYKLYTDTLWPEE